MNEEEITSPSAASVADELLRELGNPAEDAEVAVEPFRLRPGTPVAQQGKSYLLACREDIRKFHNAGFPARAIERAFARALDNVLHAVLDTGLGGAAGKRKTPPLSLLASGGYGRGELAPFSDVDLLFLVGRGSLQAAKALSDQVLYALWDLGLEVGYAIRTIADCAQMADQDDTIRTALLDARFLGGDEKLWAEFGREISFKALRKQPDRYVQTKIAHLRQRRDKYGESVYLLEPNVKEGRGGIRDYQTILWAGEVKFHVKEMGKLHELGFLNRGELAAANRYFDFLLRVRHELHFQAGAKADRLAFDLQGKVAPGMGFPPRGDPGRAAERFMRRYYLVTHEGAQLTDRILDRMLHYGKSPRRLSNIWRRPKDVGGGFELSSGQLFVRDPSLFERDPAAMMRLFEKSQEVDADLSASARELIFTNRQRAAEAFQRDPKVQESFRKILRGDRRIFRILWEMHETRLLNKFLPEFRTITCHVQRDAYHLHTTDIHTLYAVRELRRMMAGRLAKELPLATELSRNLERPHVLYLGLFCHDIGKNMGGNHSIKGVERARAICERMGLPPEDVADVEWLVLYHLLLSHIALKRDLNDPKQISSFASQVGSQERLEMLYLLTTADMRAVGPDIWTPWKGALMDEAYFVTKYALEHGRIERGDLQIMARERTQAVLAALGGHYPPAVLENELSLFPERYFLVHSPERIERHLSLILDHGGTSEADRPVRKTFAEVPLRLAHERIEGTDLYEVVVYSLDTHRFFSKTAGVFASQGLSILSAEITTLRDGTILDVFHVADLFGRFAQEPGRWDQLERDLADVLQGRVRVESLISRAALPMGLERFSSEYPTRISFDNDSSEKYTIVDVVTGDRIGLLYRVTGALSDLGLNIGLAKVSTKKERADDTFYVADIFNSKIREPAKLGQIEAALRRAIGGTALPAQPAEAGGGRSGTQSQAISSG